MKKNQIIKVGLRYISSYNNGVVSYTSFRALAGKFTAAEAAEISNNIKANCSIIEI